MEPHVVNGEVAVTLVHGGQPRLASLVRDAPVHPGRDPRLRLGEDGNRETDKDVDLFGRGARRRQLVEDDSIGLFGRSGRLSQNNPDDLAGTGLDGRDRGARDQVGGRIERVLLVGTRLPPRISPYLKRNLVVAVVGDTEGRSLLARRKQDVRWANSYALRHCTRGCQTDKEEYRCC